MEEIAEGFDDRRADPVNGREFGAGILPNGRGCSCRLCHVAQRFQRVKMLQQIARRYRADMADAEAEEQPRGIGLALVFHRRQQIIHRLVLPPLQRENGLAPLVQAENIGRPIGEPALRDEFGNGLLAQPFNIERAAADEMFQSLELLRLTDQPAGATHIHLALCRHRFAAADRAFGGEIESGTTHVASQILDHLRDHIARPLHHHPVTRPHAQPRDLVAIVQRDIGDGDPAHQHRGEPADRRQLARPPDLNIDALQRGLGPFGREFAGNRPARCLGHKAEPCLIIEPVHLIDHAVYLIIEIRPVFGDVPVANKTFIERLAAGKKRADGHAPAGDGADDLALRRTRNMARRAPAMGPEFERPLRRYARILLAERAGSGIARIGEQLAPGLFLRCIERREIGFAHINFATNFKDIRDILASQSLRNSGDMGDIGSDILAHLPVPPRGRQHQRAMLIAQRAGEPVNLVLHGESDLGILREIEIALHPLRKFEQLLVRKRIVEAKHPDFMGNFGKRRGGDVMPDLLRRRIRAHQMRELRFQLGIAADQRIIFGIGNFRSIFSMIELVMPRNLFGEAHKLVGGVSFGHCCHAGPHHTPSSKRSACARASGVTSAPLSIRAISSCRPSASSRTTEVFVTRPLDAFAIR